MQNNHEVRAIVRARVRILRLLSLPPEQWWCVSFLTGSLSNRSKLGRSLRRRRLATLSRALTTLHKSPRSRAAMGYDLERDIMQSLSGGGSMSERISIYIKLLGAIMSDDAARPALEQLLNFA